MARSSSIKASLFNGGQATADITALKTELALTKKELQDQIASYQELDVNKVVSIPNLSLYARKADTDAASAAVNKRLDDLWLSYATQSWVNDQLVEVRSAVNNIPAQMAAYAKKDEVTLAVADLPKKADKSAVDSLTTTVSGINVAVGENVAAINAEITALKARLDAIEAIL